MNKHINEENIRVAAYYIWEQAGRPEGAEKECWIKACEQLFAAKPAAKKTVCKKSSCKTSVKSTAKVVAKPAVKKTPAKASLKTKSTNINASASSLNMPFYGAKKK
ncbi:MAG: DUF2934 domain-containing protein [Alphaproteobacteria bacterium]|nr:DUF2934 domain-containing protein [Alphaproteobacteria bacterium]